MRKGTFITFEGGDGSGKSTQIKMLVEKLKSMGEDVVLTREPGGTVLGEQIRNILLANENAEMSAMTEAMLYAAARAQHLEEVVKPALAEDKIVICDRYVDSSIAYQGYGRGLGAMVKEINDFVTDDYMPDMTFFLNLDPEKSQERMQGMALDRIESEGESFKYKVQQGYEELAENEPSRIIKIDADKSAVEIHHKIMGKTLSLIKTNKAFDEFIDREKLAEYIKKESIMEFDSPEDAMHWFNVYDHQKFKTVDEMKEFLGECGFGRGNKWYAVLYFDALKTNSEGVAADKEKCL